MDGLVKAGHKRLKIRTKRGCHWPEVMLDGKRVGLLERGSEQWLFVPSGSLLVAIQTDTMTEMKAALRRRYQLDGGATSRARHRIDMPTNR